VRWKDWFVVWPLVVVFNLIVSIPGGDRRHIAGAVLLVASWGGNYRLRRSCGEADELKRRWAAGEPLVASA